jgi:Tfp pilus assembly protein PilV
MRIRPKLKEDLNGSKPLETVLAANGVPGSFQTNAAAFTIIEVMIAMGIFFMAVFAILSLVSSNLRIARRLQEPEVNAANVLAAELTLTNQLQEGSDSEDLGKMYPGYNCEEQKTLFKSNGLFRVDFVVTGPSVGGQAPAPSVMSVLYWKPNSVSGLSTPSFGGGRR